MGLTTTNNIRLSNVKEQKQMTIKVIDQSHDYSMYLRFTLDGNMVKTQQWFDIVDNTELGE